MTSRVIVLLSLLSAACTTDARTGERRFQLAGVVAGREAPPRLVIAHEAVAGLMPAMRMAFDLAITQRSARRRSNHSDPRRE